MRTVRWNWALAIALALSVSGIADRVTGQEVPPSKAGMLVVIVQDEDGQAIPGARVGIVNQDEEEMVAIAKSNGQVRGEVLVDMGPFDLHVTAERHLEHVVYRVSVKEGALTEIRVVLRRAGP